MGAIHHPGGEARQAAGRPQRRGHSDGGLLPHPAWSSTRLRAFSICAHAGQRKVERGRRQPSHAPLSGRNHPGPYHRGGAEKRRLMRVDAFDFELPEELIALRPASPRESARLLIVRENGAREHRIVSELPELLRAGDALVVNDTRVIPARLSGRRLDRGGGGEGAKVELTLHKRISPAAFRAFLRPAKRVKPGDRISLGVSLEGVIASREGGEVEIVFKEEGVALDAAIAGQGEMPLPPYIAGRRKPDARDRVDYQTVYARDSGSVAAPTAGLHFTPELLARLAERGVVRTAVTLHVGAGTFLPVS